MMKKQSASLIAKLLNKNSQPIQGSKNAEEIIMRDVHEIVPNPKNEKYSLDNIEELAMMIQLTHNIEPIILKVMEDGRFMITSGHRRRLAQLYRLKQGMTNDPMVPTITREIVNDFEDAITDDEMETLNVVFPNKGQRRHLTPSQEAEEIALIKPIIKKLYDYQKAEGKIDGKFRTYFANILGISETSLQRKEAIRKVSDDVKAEVDAGNITATAAAELATMDKTEQNSIVESIKDRGEEITVQAVKEEKKKVVAPRENSSGESTIPSEEAVVEDEEQPNFLVKAPEAQMEGSNPKGVVGQPLARIQSQATVGKESAAKIWFQQELAEKVKEAEARLILEPASGVEEERYMWEARIQLMKDVLCYLDGFHRQECCNDCEQSCEHAKHIQVENTVIE